NSTKSEKLKWVLAMRGGHCSSNKHSMNI
ncbi:bacterial regulatory helix-turn-helix, lysR family protein, partial [Vibrio parahaemolyticus V-223/04]